MKKRTLFCIILLFFIYCSGTFPSRYERIENDQMRTVDFVYNHNGFAEGAPGDTVHFSGYFAGKSIENIRLTISTDVITGQIGVDTFGDTFSFHEYIIPETYHEYFGGNEDSIAFDFIIPENLIKEKFKKFKTVGEMLPVNGSFSIPENIRTLNPEQIIEIIELLSDQPLATDPTMADSLMSMFMAGIENPQLAIVYLLQAFTIKMKVLVLVNGTEEVESGLVIRYNTSLHKNFPNIPVNRNPEISWIRMYRVKGNRAEFDPIQDIMTADTFFSLGDSVDTITISKGYSYFLVADSGVESMDSGFSQTGYRDREIYNYEWFYRNDDTISNLPLDSLLLLETNFDASSVKVLPPLSKQMKHFTLWLVVTDLFRDERFRPVGSYCKQMKGFFKYD